MHVPASQSIVTS